MSTHNTHTPFMSPIRSSHREPIGKVNNLVWSRVRQAWVHEYPVSPADTPPPNRGSEPTSVMVDKHGDWWYVKFNYHARFVWILKNEIPGKHGRRWCNSTKTWLVHEDWTRILFFLLYENFATIIMSDHVRESNRVQRPITHEEHQRILAEAAEDDSGAGVLDVFGSGRAINEEREDGPNDIPSEVKSSIKHI